MIIILELRQSHFLLQPLICLAGNLITWSCVVVFLTCGEFSNVVIRSYAISYWLIKKVSTINHNVVVFFPPLEENTLCFLSWPHYFQMITQRVCWLLENSDQPGIPNLVLRLFWHFWLIFIPIDCPFESWIQLF